VSRTPPPEADVFEDLRDLFGAKKRILRHDERGPAPATSGAANEVPLPKP